MTTRQLYFVHVKSLYLWNLYLLSSTWRKQRKILAFSLLFAVFQETTLCYYRKYHLMLKPHLEIHLSFFYNLHRIFGFDGPHPSTKVAARCQHSWHRSLLQVDNWWDKGIPWGWMWLRFQLDDCAHVPFSYKISARRGLKGKGLPHSDSHRATSRCAKSKAKVLADRAASQREGWQRRFAFSCLQVLTTPQKAHQPTPFL